MPKDNQYLVRVNDPTSKAIEEFAEDRDFNHAEAIREIVQSRLVSEGYLPKQYYGGPAMADGGEIRELEAKIDQQTARQDRLMWMSLASILWIAGEVTVGYPAWFVIISGILLVIGLVVSLVLFWGGRDE